MSSLPCIVLVGRPNVGKSTLFNRLIRSNRAITHDRPGVTRDRMEGVVRRKGHPDFGIVDTGGITLDAHAMVTEGPEGIRGFESDILRQAEAAMKDACAVAFVVDGRDGLLPLDEYLAAHIRRMGLPTLCVVNKVDGLEKEDELLAEFHSLGFPLLPVSAEHGHNIRALTEELADLLPDDYEAEHEPPALRLAMLGRPNAGKSSMINALAGEERMIVSDAAAWSCSKRESMFRVMASPATSAWVRPRCCRICRSFSPSVMAAPPAKKHPAGSRALCLFSYAFTVPSAWNTGSFSR